MLSDAKSGYARLRLTPSRRNMFVRYGIALSAIIAVGAVQSFGQSQAPVPAQPAPGQSKPNQAPLQKTANRFDRAQSQLDATKIKLAESLVLTIGNINVPPASIGDTVTFQTPVYKKSPIPVQYVFALQGNPYGSYIDQNSGAFTWVPRVSGTFTFYVWVADANDFTRQAYQQVQITVNPNLQLFGYSIFAKSRAVINTRMILIKSGLLQGVTNLQNVQNGGALGGAVPLASNTPNANAQGQNPFAATNLFGSSSQPSSLIPQANSQSSLVPGTFVPPITPFGSGNSQGIFGGSTPGSSMGQGSGTSSGATTGLSDQAKMAILQSLLGNGSNGGATGLPGSSLGSGDNSGFVGSPQSPFSGSIPGMGSPSGSAGFQMPTPMDNLSTFSSSGPSGLSIVPSSAFAGLSNMTMSAPQANGQPSGNAGLTANALQYLVGPLEEMGMNVYIPFPDRYQLGAGDLLTVRIWSDTLAAQDYDLKVDNLGRISLPGDSEKIVVRGMSLAKAQDFFKQRVSTLYRHGKVTVTLKALRTMSVQILGEAYMPGAYQVPAVATLFNTLIVCGGPTDQGSLRRVELRRTDGSKQTFDLYDYLTKGDTRADVPLQPGDVIFIPTIKNRVNVKGEVSRPAIYETLEKDTLKDLLRYAGGAKATGVTQRISLETEEPGIGHTVRDVDLTTANPSASLYDGDTLTVFSVRDEVLNAVNLEGAVDQAGQFEYRKGLTVADLLDKARGLRTNAYRARADLYRQNPDKTETLIPIDLEKAIARNPESNLSLLPHDRIHVYFQDEAVWRGTRKVEVAGAVQKPGPYARQDAERVLDLLLQAGGVTGDAFLNQAILQRTNPDGTLGPLFRIDLRKLVTADPSQNVLLEDRDVLTILTVKDAMYVPDQTVSILGAVQNPGNYSSASNMHLSDALHEAGGLTPDVGEVIEIKRARVPDTTPAIRIKVADLLSGNQTADILLLPGDLITVPNDAKIVLHPRKIILVGEVNNPGPYSVTSTDRLSDIIERAGGLRKDAFVDGMQFYRDPDNLVTDTQRKIMPQIVDTLRIVAQDEFTRALASADVQKIRLIQSGGGSGSSSSLLPILTGGGGASVGSAPNIPSALWDEKTVTQARDIANTLTPSGNMSVHLASALKHRGSTDDILLADGDIILVPKTPSTTSILGAVAIPSAVLYQPGKTVGYYVNRAGGFTIDAAKDRMLLIRADGLVEKAKMSTKVGLGDQLLVPTHVMAAKFEDKAAEIDAV